MPPNESAIAQLRKILAMQQGAELVGNYAEAEVAAEKMVFLLQKYNLSLEQLNLSDLKLSDSIDKIRVSGFDYNFPLSRKRVAWQEAIGHAIAEATNTEILVSQGSNLMAFVGTKTDREVAGYVFSYLVREMGPACQKSYDRDYYLWVEKEKQPPSVCKGYKESWFMGSISILSQRLRDKFAQATVEAGVDSSTALVYQGRVKTAIAAYFKADSTIHSVPGVKCPKNTSHGAFQLGVQFGTNVSLNRGLATSSSKLLTAGGGK